MAYIVFLKILFDRMQYREKIIIERRSEMTMWQQRKLSRIFLACVIKRFLIFFHFQV
jgi:hypothetical protein